MTPIYGCSTDMGGVLSRGQGEAAASTVAGAAASCWPDESACGVERVDADALSSLKCAGWLPQDRWFRVGVDRLSRIEREHVVSQRVCS